MINFPRVLVCRHDHLFPVPKAALAAVVSDFTRRRVAVESIVVSRTIIIAVSALLRVRQLRCNNS
jgi:hypothetical protein